MSVNSDSNNGLNQLISQLVGKIGEEELTKILNVASNCLEDGKLVISQAKGKEVSNNEILYVKDAKTKSKSKKGSNTESDDTSQDDSNKREKSEGENSKNYIKSNYQKNSKSRSDKTVRNKRQKLSLEESSVKRRKISLDKTQKSTSELDNSCTSGNTSSSDILDANWSSTRKNDSNIHENSASEFISLSKNDLGASDEVSTNNKTTKKPKHCTDKESLKCHKNVPQKGINESEIPKNKNSKVGSITKQNSQHNDLNKNLEKTDTNSKSNDTKSRQRTDCNIQKDTSVSNVDNLEKREEHQNIECNKLNPKKKLRRDGFTSEQRVLRSRVGPSSSDDKSNARFENTNSSRKEYVEKDLKHNNSDANLICSIDKSSKYEDELINQQDLTIELGDPKRKNDKNFEITTKKQKIESEPILENKEESFRDQSKLVPNKKSNSKRNLKRKQSSVQIQKDLSEFKTVEETSTVDETLNEVKSKMEGRSNDETDNRTTEKLSPKAQNKQSSANKKRTVPEKSVLDSNKKGLKLKEQKQEISKQTARDSTDTNIKNAAKTKKEEKYGTKQTRGSEFNDEETEKVNIKQNSKSDFTTLIKTCYVNLKREDLEKKMIEAKSVRSKTVDEPDEDDLNKDREISSKLAESENVFKSSWLRSNGEKKDRLSNKRCETKENKRARRNVDEFTKIKGTNVETGNLKNGNGKKAERSNKEESNRSVQKLEKPKSNKKEKSADGKAEEIATVAKILNNENSLETVDFNKDKNESSETDFPVKRTKEDRSKILANKTKLTYKKSSVGRALPDLISKRQLTKEETESVSNENRSADKEKLTKQTLQKEVRDKNESMSVADGSENPGGKNKNRSVNVKDGKKDRTNEDECADKVSREKTLPDESQKERSSKNGGKNEDDGDKSANKDNLLEKQTQNIGVGKELFEDRTENRKKWVDKEDLVKEAARGETPKKQSSRTENKARKLRRLQIDRRSINDNEKVKVKSTIEPPSPVKKGSDRPEDKEKTSAEKDVNVEQRRLEEESKYKSSETQSKESKSPNVGKIRNVNRNNSFTGSGINKCIRIKTTTNILNLKSRTEDSSKEKSSNSGANKIDGGEVSYETNTNLSNSGIPVKKDAKISVKSYKKDELSVKSNENVGKESVKSLVDEKLSVESSKVGEEKRTADESRGPPEKFGRKTNDASTAGEKLTVESPPFRIRKLKRNNVEPRILKPETQSNSSAESGDNGHRDGRWPDDDNSSADKNIQKIVQISVSGKEAASNIVSGKEKRPNRKSNGEKIFTIKDNIRIKRNFSDGSEGETRREFRVLKRSRDPGRTASTEAEESENASKKIRTFDKFGSGDEVSKSTTPADHTTASARALQNITEVEPKNFSGQKDDGEAKSVGKLLPHNPENANLEKLRTFSSIEREIEENSEENRAEKAVKKPFKVQEDDSFGFSGLSPLEISPTETQEASDEARIGPLIVSREEGNCQLLPLILDVRQVSSSEWESSDSIDVTRVSENTDPGPREAGNIYRESGSLETYDKYGDLREQFRKAGVSLEEAIRFVDAEKLKSAVENGEEDACVLLGRTHYCRFSGRIVQPSLVVVKSYKRFVEAKDRVLRGRYGVKRSRVVLNVPPPGSGVEDS